MSNSWWWLFWFSLYALGMQFYQEFLPILSQKIMALDSASFFIVVTFTAFIVIVALSAVYKSLDK